MCGRFSARYTWAEVQAYYSLIQSQPPSNMRPRYNVCPTTTIDAVTREEAGRSLRRMRWGLIPAWWSNPLKEMRLATFNARAETAHTKPFFRQAFKTRRCLIPVSGYYEWQDTPGGKQPWYFTRADGDPIITTAGLWDEWTDKVSGEIVTSCSMLITEPNAMVAEVHDRMPVILEPGQWEQWEKGSPVEIAELMRPAPEGLLQRRPVSRRVNSSRADDDDVSLIELIKV